MLEIIKEAEAKGYDVLITDGFTSLVRCLCSNDKWYAIGELGWYYSNEDIAKFEIVETEEDDFFYITVKEI